MTAGVITIVLFGCAQLAGLAAKAAGRREVSWDVVVAVSGAGIAAGGVWIQTAPDAVSWMIAAVAGAVVAVVHARALFAPGGPFRT